MKVCKLKYENGSTKTEVRKRKYERCLPTRSTSNTLSNFRKCAYHLNFIRIVGNIREGFIFAFFASQEPFAKIKTEKFLLATCKASDPRFNPAYFKQSSRPNSNRSLPQSVPLTAIAQAIQEIEVSTDARTGRRSKAGSGSNRFYERPGYEATFLATLEQTADIAISLCKQF